MFFIKWISALILWCAGVVIIPGLMISALTYPLFYGFNRIAPLLSDESTILLITLGSIYGFIFTYAAYYIYIFFSEILISKYLKLPYLIPPHSLGLKSFFSNMKHNSKVRTRFIACNIILIAWASLSIFIKSVQEPGYQLMLFLGYYILSLFILFATLIFFSTSLSDDNMPWAGSEI